MDATEYNLAILADEGTVAPSFVNLDTKGHEIIGMAVLESSLYVVCDDDKDNIYVFSLNEEFKLTRTIKVGGDGFGDMVADPVSKQLYIFGFHPFPKEEVWRFDPATDHYEKYCETAHWTGTLALTANRELAGVFNRENKDGFHEYGLNLYSETSGMRTHLFRTEIQPQHAIIPTSQGEVYVCYGTLDSNTPVGHRLNRVVELSADFKREIHEVPDNVGLNFARYLAIDTDKRNLFVADYWNRRVLRFDSQLKSPYEVLHFQPDSASSGVGWPQRLLFDQSTKRLFVAMAKKPMPKGSNRD